MIRDLGQARDTEIRFEVYPKAASRPLTASLGVPTDYVMHGYHPIIFPPSRVSY